MQMSTFQAGCGIESDVFGLQWVFVGEFAGSGLWL